MTSVLLVDDHELLRDALVGLIESREDVEVVGQANDGTEAVALARQLRPDITLMDIRLPSISGIDATIEILKDDPDAKVIILSADEKRSVVERSLRAGAVGYLVKSACSRELFAAIEAVRDGRSYLSSAVIQPMLDSLQRGEVRKSDRPRAEEVGVDSLTTRERQVLERITDGLSNKAIGESLSISTRTVETHRARLMRKLGVRNASSLVRVAIREDLVTP